MGRGKESNLKGLVIDGLIVCSYAFGTVTGKALEYVTELYHDLKGRFYVGSISTEDQRRYNIQ